jgi:hypothetical protein
MPSFHAGSTRVKSASAAGQHKMVTREASMKDWLLMTGILVAAGFMAEHADEQNYP